MNKILKRLVTITLVTTIISLSVGSVGAYNNKDIPNDNDYGRNVLGYFKIINNYTDKSKYRFDDNITRGEFAKIIAKARQTMDSYKEETFWKNYNSGSISNFKDLSKNNWVTPYAEFLLYKGYISKNEKFRPNDFITELEALKIITLTISSKEKVEELSKGKIGIEEKYGSILKSVLGNLRLNEFPRFYNKPIQRGAFFYIISLPISQYI